MHRQWLLGSSSELRQISCGSWYVIVFTHPSLFIVSLSRSFPTLPHPSLTFPSLPMLLFPPLFPLVSSSFPCFPYSQSSPSFSFLYSSLAASILSLLFLGRYYFFINLCSTISYLSYFTFTLLPLSVTHFHLSCCNKYVAQDKKNNHDFDLKVSHLLLECCCSCLPTYLRCNRPHLIFMIDT